MTASAKALDHKGAISAAVKSGDINGKPGSTLLLRNLDGVAAERVLLVGLGSEDSVSDKNFSVGGASHFARLQFARRQRWSDCTAVR
ncbi:M17 family peptidase N-terminal domain-containing protein [Undibacterium arcticum]